MRKYLILFLFFLSSCSSISYNDLNPCKNPNKHLLPSLEPIIDVYNLEAIYSKGRYEGLSANITYSGTYTGVSSISGIQYGDPRVNDTINIFNKEVKDNITNPYGEKKGYISLRLTNRLSENSDCYLLFSSLTGCLLNIIGFPFNKVSDTLEMEVEILNKNKEIVKRYTEVVLNSNYVAMYWGYSENDVLRKVAADNIKQGLEKIRFKIEEDFDIIEKSLK